VKIIPYLIDRVERLGNGSLGIDVLFRERGDESVDGDGKLSRTAVHHQLFYEIEGMDIEDEMGVRKAVEQRLVEDGF